MPTVALDLAGIPLSTIVLFILYFVLGAYAIFSAILYYHWETYATEHSVKNLTLLLYFGMTIPLLLIMTIMALII